MSISYCSKVWSCVRRPLVCHIPGLVAPNASPETVAGNEALRKSIPGKLRVVRVQIGPKRAGGIFVLNEKIGKHAHEK